MAQKVEGFDACPVTTMPEELHDSMFIGERSADYIREHANSDKPFFLVASFPDPHHPVPASAGNGKTLPGRTGQISGQRG